MTTTVPPLDPSSDSPKQILMAIAGCILTVISADQLLWGATPGISLSLFGLILMGVILATRSHVVLHSAIISIISVLLVGALVSSALEISFTNVCILVSLFTLLAGDDGFPKLGRSFSSLAGHSGHGRVQSGYFHPLPLEC